MNRKSVLVASVFGLFVVGLIYAGTPFMVSLKPNAKAYANLPRFPIPELAPKSHIYVPHPLATQWFTAKILVINDKKAERHNLYIPTIDGISAIPDYYAWRAGWKCYDLSPDFKSETIRCKDTNSSHSRHEKLGWRFDGESIIDDAWIPDLESIKGKEVNGDFVLLHPNDA